MAAKFLTLFVIASVLTQGFPSALPGPRSLIEITLEDEFVEFMTNELIGRALTIPKSFLDTLETCHVILPGGAMHEAYPNDNLPASTGIVFLAAQQPFTSCSIGFKNAPVSRSGTYELISVVQHTADASRSLTRQRFHLTLRDIPA